MTQPRTRSAGRWRLGPGLFTARPKLMIAFGLGLATGIGSAVLVPGILPSSSAIAGALILALTINLLAGLV